MGIVSPTLSTQLLSLAPVSEQGRVSAAQGLAISTGVALSTAVVGAVVALRGAETDGAAFAAAHGRRRGLRARRGPGRRPRHRGARLTGRTRTQRG